MRLLTPQKQTGDPSQTLWTKGFLSLGIGSFFSNFSSGAVVFLLGYYILDVYQSNFLYSLTLAISNITGIVLPILGAFFLEKTYKNRLLVQTDLLNGLFALLTAFLFQAGLLPLYGVTLYCLLLSVLNATYSLSCQSLLPRLIQTKLYPKAFSVSGLLRSLAKTGTFIGILLYNQRGLSFALYLTAGLFFLSALIERNIPKVEQFSGPRTKNVLSLKQSLSYLKQEKLLFCLMLFALFLNLSLGAFYTLTLPLLKAQTYWNIGGEYLYFVVMGALSAGESWGGALGYKILIPPKRRGLFYLCLLPVFLTCLTAFIYLPIPFMLPVFFIAGISSVLESSYRNSACYAQSDPAMTTKITGFMQTLCSLGYVLGILLSGFLGDLLGFALTLIILNGSTLCILLALFLPQRHAFLQLMESAALKKR